MKIEVVRAHLGQTRNEIVGFGIITYILATRLHNCFQLSFEIASDILDFDLRKMLELFWVFGCTKLTSTLSITPIMRGVSTSELRNSASLGNTEEIAV